jgi:hypothetical protein
MRCGVGAPVSGNGWRRPRPMGLHMARQRQQRDLQGLKDEAYKALMRCEGQSLRITGNKMKTHRDTKRA